MFNKTKRIFAVLLAVALVLSLVGCNKKVEESSSADIEFVEDIEYVFEDGSTGDSGDAGDNTPGNSESGTNNSSGGDTTKPKNVINDNVDPADYKGKTVKFAATIDPKNDESGPVVEAFQKKYGITVDVDIVDQGNFANEINAKIAAGKSPDVVRVNADFPTCMGYLQSLDAAKLNYKEDIWNQQMFKISTFGGSPYLCDTKNNIWGEIDVVIYSKSLLERAGANTPEQYDQAGKWTWDAYFDICRKVKALGSNMQGGGFNNAPISAIYAMGGGLIQYEDGKFVSGVNARTQEALVKYSTAWKEGIIEWDTTSGIVDGTVGIMVTHIWALKKTGFFQNTGYNTGDLGYYYLPRWDEGSDYGSTGMVRGWGLVRGAQQPVAAGIFMREYLDVANYDTSNTFINKDAEEFFFKATSIDYSNWNPQIIYYKYNDAICGSEVSASEFYYAAVGDPAQVGTQMAAIKSTMEKAASNMNKFVEQNTGQN